MTMELGPLRAGELLDRTLSMLRRNFLLFAGIAAIPLVLKYALAMGVAYWQIAAIQQQLKGELLAASLVLVLIELCLIPLGVGACAWAVSCLAKGESASIATAYREASRSLASLFGATLLAWLVLSGAGALAGIGGALVFIILKVIAFTRPLVLILLTLVGGVAISFVIWVVMGMALVHPAIVLERLGPMRGLKRSWNLSSGYRRYALMLCALYFSVTLVVQGAISLPLSIPLFNELRRGQIRPIPFHTQLLTGALGTAAAVLLFPILCIGLTLIYLNLRVKLEAFDLEVMMSRLEPVPSEAVPDAAASSDSPTGD